LHFLRFKVEVLEQTIPTRLRLGARFLTTK